MRKRKVNRELIGIISYLPDNLEIREHRKQKLIGLINKCNELFDLPIYIVIQNYTEEEEEFLSNIPNVMTSPRFQKLGILSARKILRRTFLAMNFDTLIMLDDDCELIGTKSDGQEYLRQLREHPDCFGEFKSTLLKLFSIPRKILKDEDYPLINPELEEGFEDRVFVNKLRIKYPSNRFVYNCKLREISVAAKDIYSTWYSNQDLNKMGELTQEKITNLNKEC